MSNGLQHFLPISDTEWEWVCNAHGRHCTACPRHEPCPADDGHPTGRAARTLVYQAWEESERGWGVRPDGYSLHPTRQALDEYVRSYWADMPVAVPDEYSRPSGDPTVVDVDDPELLAELEAKGFVRRYQGRLR